MGKNPTKAISYRLQSIDGKRFMVSSLSKFADNLAEKIPKTKFKYGHDSEKRETCGVKQEDCKS